MGNSCCACGRSSEFRFSILTGMRKWEVAESTPFIVFLKMAKSCGIPQPIIVSSQLWSVWFDRSGKQVYIYILLLELSRSHYFCCNLCSICAQWVDMESTKPCSACEPRWTCWASEYVSVQGVSCCCYTPQTTGLKNWQTRPALWLNHGFFSQW